MKPLQILLLLILNFLFSVITTGQDDANTLNVGIKHTPPYAIKDDSGKWTGMTVELWRQLAEAEGAAYRFVELDPGTSRPRTLNNDRLDVALTTNLDSELTDSTRFLQHHHLTTLGVAQPSSSGLWSTVRGVFNQQFLYIVLSLSALLLLIGTIIYFLERKQNEEQFGGDRSLAEGIGSGFWWAGVTMTTIGYGDKAPETLPGRAVAMLWMLLAMAVSASLTASIISATNSKDQISFPEDLKNMKVAVVEKSPAAEYLEKRGYDFETFATTKEALRAMNDEKIEVVVDDVTALRYAVDNDDSLTADVQSTASGTVAFALMVAENDGMAERFDRHQVELLLSPSWQEILSEYGAGKQR